MESALILSQQRNKINLLRGIPLLDRVNDARNSFVHIIGVKRISLTVFHRLNLRLEVSAWAEEILPRRDIKRLSELWITHLFHPQSSQPLDDVLSSRFRVEAMGLITALGERHQVISDRYRDLFSAIPSVIFLHELLLLLRLCLKALDCKLVQLHFPFFFLSLFRFLCLLSFPSQSKLMQKLAWVR